MRSCFQTKGMSIYDHGVSVRAWYLDLREHILLEKPLQGSWRLPTWITDSKIKRHFELANDEIIETYQIFHDCGKPLCRVVDVDGCQHFPDHADVSRQTWMKHSDESEMSRQIGELIGMDMDVHLMKAADVEEFSKRPQALTLLITSLCEVHSNAQMFGGIGSDGFKAKFKKIDRFGSRIVGAV